MTTKKKREGALPGHHVDGMDTVLALQFSMPSDKILDATFEHSPQTLDSHLAYVIAAALRQVKARPTKTKPWMFFASDTQPGDLCNWLGVGASVPASFVDALQRELESHGCRTNREHTPIAPASIRPLLVLTSTGADVPPGVGSGIEEPVLAHLGVVTRVPFTIDLTEYLKNTLMTRLMLGAPSAPLVLRAYVEDRHATFHFARVSLRMLVRHGDGSFTAGVQLSAEPPCLVMFDFADELLAQLDELASDRVMAMIRGMSSSQKMLPENTLVVGVRAGPAPQELADATCLAVESFTAASDGGIRVEYGP